MSIIYSNALTAPKVERILLLLCAFPKVLQEHVQGFDVPSQYAKFLSPTDMRDIERVTNRPNFILTKMMKELSTIREVGFFTARERQSMMKHVDDLSTCIGSAERLVQTPVPLTYARHTSRFLSLFCLSAPIALVGELGAYVVPFVTFMAWSLFGILEIGMMIEEPFQRALKLEVFANTIQRDLSDLLHISDVSPIPLDIKCDALKYEVPEFTRGTESFLATMNVKISDY
jgi:predicted membrane chloride channel (bestrophin family)